MMNLTRDVADHIIERRRAKEMTVVDLNQTLPLFDLPANEHYLFRLAMNERDEGLMRAILAQPHARPFVRGYALVDKAIADNNRVALRMLSRHKDFDIGAFTEKSTASTFPAP